MTVTMKQNTDTDLEPSSFLLVVEDVFIRLMTAEPNDYCISVSYKYIDTDNDNICVLLCSMQCLVC